MTTVAQRVVDTLEELGVRYAFGLPGGNLADYMDAFRRSKVRFVLVSNEATAGFMAMVCGRLTGTPGACFGTFGPGATNLSTGVGCGLLDRLPCLAFTDEVPDAMLHRTMQMKIDHQALFAVFTKWTARLSADRVKETLYRAMQVALSEAPGPVHVGLPAGLGSVPAGEEKISPQPAAVAPAPDAAALDRMVRIFGQAKKPVLAVGWTAVRAGVKPLLLQVAERVGAPIVLTPMAKGMCPEDHLCYTGVLNHALNNLVGKTHQQADLVVGVGFDPAELNYEEWIPNAPVLHLDTSPADLDQSRYTLAGDIVGDLGASMRRLAAADLKKSEWDLAALARQRAQMFARLEPPAGSFGPRAVLAGLRQALPEDGIMACDVGAHLHLIGQQWRTPEPDTLLMTNGWSSMGYGIPAAIAAKLCRPDTKVCCVVGDGGFLMMAGEMATAMRLGVHVVFVLITDRSLTLIRIKQERKGFPEFGTPLYGDTYESARTFFGVPVLAAHDEPAYRKALTEAFAMNGPVIVEAFVDGHEYDDLLLKGNRA
jgi:acetolactate synthase I/II/III large subunit